MNNGTKLKNISTSIQILSTLALLLLLGIFTTAAFLIISNPGLFLLYAICGLGMIIGAWLFLSSRGGRMWWGVAVGATSAVLALAVTWALLFKTHSLGNLVLLAGLIAAYSALTTLIARLYWQDQRQAAQPQSRRQPAVLIINPKSGDGRAIKANIKDKANTQNIRTVVLEPNQDMVALAEKAIADGARVLGVSGGDGSLGAMAAVAIKHDLPLVVLPGGTRCHFARDIGLNPDQIADALAGFEGIERRVDVGQIENRLFLNNASFGLYADIIANEDYRDHKLEVTTRVTRELASSKKPFYPINFTDHEGHNWHHAAQVFVGVNRYETLNLSELGERKRLDEGLLHIIAIRSLTGDSLKQLTGTLNLAQTSSPALAQWTTQSFEVYHPSGWIDTGIDGESLRLKSPVQLRIRPKALRLLVPAEGIRARPITPVSGTAAKTLWSLITAKRLPPKS